jgi:hypothetical protein
MRLKREAEEDWGALVQEVQQIVLLARNGLGQ